MHRFLCYYLDYLAQKEEMTSEPVRFPTLDEIKKEYMAFLLQITEHDIEETSEILDIAQETVFRKMVGA